eukprot:TRINITY_DN30127_c0_g1_i2.p1 TRINITY_DN30127_c0_g1~~TRINITY_DN30127_c0_g1_i2.p1  ORF type:complete len:554 (+),score=127.85 TRINITY_DN30127_c0_g1_i2:116-1663(+)
MDDLVSGGLPFKSSTGSRSSPADGTPTVGTQGEQRNGEALLGGGSEGELSEQEQQLLLLRKQHEEQKRQLEQLQQDLRGGESGICLLEPEREREIGNGEIAAPNLRRKSKWDEGDPEVFDVSTEDPVSKQPKRTRWDESVDTLPPLLGTPDATSTTQQQLNVAPGLTLKNGVTVWADAAKMLKELQIPSTQKGALIGRGGEFINLVRRESKAAVKVSHDDGEPITVVELKGRPEEVEKAETMINNRMTEQSQPGVKWEMKAIDVPKELIGDTIGQGGSNLHQMASMSECRIKFVQATEIEEGAEPGKQVCVIRGPPDKIAYAEFLLTEKVAEVQFAHEQKRAHGYFNSPAPVGPLPQKKGKGAVTVPCRFHMRRAGSCKNGDWCNFSHDPSLIAAALGESISEDLPIAQAPEYKATYCRFFEFGRCTRGATCVFAHGLDDLRGDPNDPRNVAIKLHVQQQLAAGGDMEQWLGEDFMGDVGSSLLESSIPAAFKTAMFLKTKSFPKIDLIAVAGGE